MKARRTEIDSLINLLLYSFRNGDNLPFVIPTKTCPDLKPSKKLKKRKCKKRHSEIVVQAYLPTEKMYRCLYYSMHEPKNIDQFDQQEEIVKSILKRSLTKKKYGGRTLLEVRRLKKILDKNQPERHKKITFRVSIKEWKSIHSKADNRGLEISDYIRMKLFS